MKKNNRDNNCCDKRGFTTEKEARGVMNHMKKRGKGYVAKRVYRCPVCKLRHLTHLPDYKF